MNTKVKIAGVEFKNLLPLLPEHLDPAQNTVILLI